MKSKNKKSVNSFVLYLSLTFGICWGLIAILVGFYETLYPIFGEMTIFNPIVMAALYAPTTAGLIVYFVEGGVGAVKHLLMKLIPRKKDLIWFPVIFVMVVLFVACMHYGSLAFGIPVPERTFTLPQMFYQAFINLFEETGLIGGAFGWFGYLLPYLQKKWNSTIKSGLVTGFLFGLLVLPGYAVDSFQTATLYPFYVAQLMVFSVFIAYLFNVTKGNLLLYIFTFWLVACGSRLQFYYFIPQVQIMQIGFFLLAAAVLHLVLKTRKMEYRLQLYPDYIYQ